MVFISKYLSPVLFFSSALAAAGSAQVTQAAPASQASQASRALVAEAAHYSTGRAVDGSTYLSETLPNGVVLIVHPSTASDVVGMEIVSRVGTRSEPAGQAGLTALMLRTVLDGETDLPGTAIHTWFDDHGSTLSAVPHPDYCEIGTAAPSGSFTELATLLAGLVKHPALNPVDVIKEQRSLLGEIGSSNRDERRASYESLRHLLADGSAYGRTEFGYAPTVAGLSAANVSDCYHRVFASQALVVAVSGNVAAPEAMNLLVTLFGDTEPGPASTLQQAAVEGSPNSLSLVTAGYGDDAWIMVGCRMPGVRDPAYAAGVILNAIVGGSDSGLIPTHFRSAAGVYESGSFLQPFADQAHIASYVRADPLLWDQQAQKMRPVVDELQRGLVDIFVSVSDHGVSPVQLETGRQFAIGSYLRAHEHNRAFAGYLAWYEAIGLGAACDKRFIEDLQKVTLLQVNDLARARFGSPDRATVVMLPRPRVEDLQ